MTNKRTIICVAILAAFSMGVLSACGTAATEANTCMQNINILTKQIK